MEKYYKFHVKLPQFHPIANLFPLMEGKEFEELVADVEANGVHESIVMYEGKILDGRNRARAANKTGRPSQWYDYEGNDPVGFVISLNLKRRHLTEGQRAWVAAQIANLPSGVRASQICEGAVTRDQAAELLKVSPRSIDSARVVRDHGVAELQDKVAKGELAPSTASDIARLPESEQQEIVARGEKEILQAAKAIRAKKSEVMRAVRIEKLAEIAKGNCELGTEVCYPIIYADPPWRYDHESGGGENRAIENQYPTMTLEDICGLPIWEMATDDALLFIWATAPKLAECMEVIKAWDFDYRTCMVWDKEIIGMGYYVRSQHELLLIAKRGEIPPPSAGTQCSSVYKEKRGQHSAKPIFFYEMIEKAYPELPKLELFARNQREGWTSWGNQKDIWNNITGKNITSKTV